MSGFCNICGAEMTDSSSDICPVCGAAQHSGNIPKMVDNITTEGSYYQQPVYTQPYYPMMEYYEDTSVGGWIGWQLLCVFLPVIGFIIAAASAKNKTFRNWAFAQLVVMGIFVVLYIVLFVVLLAVVVPSLPDQEEVRQWVMFFG